MLLELELGIFVQPLFGIKGNGTEAALMCCQASGLKESGSKVTDEGDSKAMPTEIHGEQWRVGEQC